MEDDDGVFGLNRVPGRTQGTLDLRLTTQVRDPSEGSRTDTPSRTLTPGLGLYQGLGT